MASKARARSKIAEAIAGGIRASRRGASAYSDDIERAIKHRGNPRAPLSRFNLYSINKRISRIARAAFSDKEAPIKVAAHSSVARAAGDAGLARRLLRERNEFGRTLNQELQGAKMKTLRRIKRRLREGASRGESQASVARDVAEIWRKNHAANRVVSFWTARAANEKALLELAKAGADFILIAPSRSHPKPDVCDQHFGIKPRAGARIPPFHSHCACLVLPAPRPRA